MKAMNKPLCTLILFVMGIASACPRTPRCLLPSDAELVCLGSGLPALDYTLRLEAAVNTDVTCTVVWNYTDTASFRACSFILPARTAASGPVAAQVPYRITARIAGTDSVINEGRIHVVYPQDFGMTVSLRCSRSLAALALGASGAECLLPVSFDTAHAGAIGYTSQKSLRELENTVLISRREPQQPLPVTDAAMLADRLRASADPLEGLWTYLDRDTDPSLAEPPGHYTLALLRDADGYALIALGNPGEPLTLKGRLSPTLFADHYNLRWIDREGNLIADETSATVVLDGAVLRLDFPLYKSSYRFARHPLNH